MAKYSRTTARAISAKSVLVRGLTKTELTLKTSAGKERKWQKLSPNAEAICDQIRLEYGPAIKDLTGLSMTNDVIAIAFVHAGEYDAACPVAYAEALCSIYWAKARVKGMTPFKMLTGGQWAAQRGFFGAQIGRVGATSRVPSLRSLYVATLWDGFQTTGFEGAISLIDPYYQDGGMQGGNKLSNNTIGMIRKWCADPPTGERFEFMPSELDDDAFRIFLFRRAQRSTKASDRIATAIAAYERAREVYIRVGGSSQPDGPKMPKGANPPFPKIEAVDVDVTLRDLESASTDVMEVLKRLEGAATSNEDDVLRRLETLSTPNEGR